VGSIGAACNFSLNEQGLLAGLMADTPGLEGKPIEAVENACASGGQAVLSVIQKLQLGVGETGIALMRGWELSKGAIAESSTANALGLLRFIQTDGDWLEIDANGRVKGGILRRA
jgi:acetyl-CoA acetyltransferase